MAATPVATLLASSARNSSPERRTVAAELPAASTAARTAPAAVTASKPNPAASGSTAWAPTSDWKAPVAGCVMSWGKGTPGYGQVTDLAVCPAHAAVQSPSEHRREAEAHPDPDQHEVVFPLRSSGRPLGHRGEVHVVPHGHRPAEIRTERVVHALMPGPAG